MKGCSLRFYLHETAMHRGGFFTYEHVLALAKAQGIHGGTVFKAADGYGRHGTMNHERMHVLSGYHIQIIEFILDDAEADALLKVLKAEDFPLFWAKLPAEFGSFGTD